MQMKYAAMMLFLTVVWTAAQAAMQQPAGGPPAGAPPQGGRGGGRGPNYAQQQRPPGDPAVIARGRALYGVNCTACHGVDLRGGDQGGPNLLRSEIVLTDQNGEKIIPVLRNGRQGIGLSMPPFPNPESDLSAISEYIHSVTAQIGRQGRPPERDTPFELNVLVGDSAAGQAYFERVCSRCHSSTGDLRGIATRVADARALQNLWIAGGRAGRGDDADDHPVTVTVTVPGAVPITGRLLRIDDFIVALRRDDGVRLTFRREAGVPKVEIRDPLEPHRRLVLELDDRNMHDITAYLASLR